MQKTNKKIHASKRAVSLLLAYVLLVGLAISLWGMVYAWMRLSIKQPFPEEACPEIDFYIEYECGRWPTDDKINITIRNNGRFNIDGYYVKISNEKNAEIVKYSLGKGIVIFDPPLVPGNSNKTQFDYKEHKRITLLSIQIFEKINSDIYPCPAAIFRTKVEGCD